MHDKLQLVGWAQHPRAGKQVERSGGRLLCGLLHGPADIAELALNQRLLFHYLRHIRLFGSDACCTRCDLRGGFFRAGRCVVAVAARREGIIGARVPARIRVLHRRELGPTGRQADVRRR
jgi:hypothetical protein